MFVFVFIKVTVNRVTCYMGNGVASVCGPRLTKHPIFSPTLCSLNGIVRERSPMFVYVRLLCTYLRLICTLDTMLCEMPKGDLSKHLKKWKGKMTRREKSLRNPKLARC